MIPFELAVKIPEAGPCHVSENSSFIGHFLLSPPTSTSSYKLVVKYEPRRQGRDASITFTSRAALIHLLRPQQQQLLGFQKIEEHGQRITERRHPWPLASGDICGTSYHDTWRSVVCSCTPQIRAREPPLLFTLAPGPTNSSGRGSQWRRRCDGSSPPMDFHTVPRSLCRHAGLSHYS